MSKMNLSDFDVFNAIDLAEFFQNTRIVATRGDYPVGSSRIISRQIILHHSGVLDKPVPGLSGQLVVYEQSFWKLLDIGGHPFN